MGSLLLSRTGNYGCRMSLCAGCEHEVFYLLVTLRGRRGSGHVHICNDLGGAHRFLPSRGRWG